MNGDGTGADQMVMIIAGLLVGASGAFLVVLGAAVFLVPGRAAAFLRGFASSWRAHVLEQTLRLLAGMGFVVYGPAMRWPLAFEVFGWVVVATAAGLLLVPWRWHRRFGALVIPPLIRWMWAFGIAAALLGALILFGLS